MWATSQFGHAVVKLRCMYVGRMCGDSLEATYIDLEKLQSHCTGDNLSFCCFCVCAMQTCFSFELFGLAVQTSN